MATGSGLGGLLPAAMTLIGVVTMLRARHKRKSGAPPAEVDTDTEKRRAAATEMERRMASYLAGRDTGGAHNAPQDQSGQENGR